MALQHGKRQAVLGQYVKTAYYQTNTLRTLRQYHIFIVQMPFEYYYQPIISAPEKSSNNSHDWDLHHPLILPFYTECSCGASWYEVAASTWLGHSKNKGPLRNIEESIDALSISPHWGASECII
jgi:hypothetical protein